MINRQSIFFTIIVSFLISIILVIISFMIILANSYHEQEERVFDRYIPIIRMVNRVYFNEQFIKNLEEMNYKIYTDKQFIDKITNDKNTIVISEQLHGRHNNLFKIIKNDTRYYLYAKTRSYEALIKDENDFSSSTETYIFLVFAILLITIIILYFVTFKKLIPLKILKDRVKSLGDEDFEFEYKNIDAKDEVSQLAKEFRKTGLKLKNLKEARNVFIRNIMHELKTPITKGKFLTQLEQNQENNKKLKSVFDRLESLINEFATIEELISSNKNIEKKSYFLDDIIDNSKDILMIEDEKVIQNYENKKIEVNFKLFSIAIKNLIDNAVKYSPNKEVIIKTEDNNIIFENIGKELESPFEKYFEPFFSSVDKGKNSFGLGLYIVNNIFKANGYILQYEYKNGLNRFICKKG